MTVLTTDPKDPPHFLCPSMTETEDRILRELYKNGEMTSEWICETLVLKESADNIYGAIGILYADGYISGELIVPWEWKRNYRVGNLRLTERGRRHVETTPPVRIGWTRIFLCLILIGALLSLAQSFYKEPDYGPIGLSMLTAGVLLLVGRRFGLVLMKKKALP